MMNDLREQLKPIFWHVFDPDGDAFGNVQAALDKAMPIIEAARVAPSREAEKVNGLDVHEWAKIARAKDEANAAAVAAIDDLAEAIRLTVEYTGNEILPPFEGWSWFDALMKHRPELAQPFVDNPILLHRDEVSDAPSRETEATLAAIQVEVDELTRQGYPTGVLLRILASRARPAESEKRA